jgi:tight adherence protein C
MEYLIQILGKISGDADSLQTIFVLTVSLAFFVFGLALMYLLGVWTDPLKKRLRNVASGAPEAASGHSSVFAGLHQLDPYILPRKDWERSRITEKLVHAGIRSENALTVFYTIKALLFVLLPGTVLVAVSFIPALTTNKVFMALAGAVLIALVVPNMVLDRLAQNRIKRIRNGFPDALDLLVVCSEAGLGLNAAIQRVGQELNETHPELAEELVLVNAEIRVGVDRSEALRNLAKRTGVDDIKGMVALLTQSMRLGTGVAETLRIFSEELRDKRMQRAEELAAKLGTKMIFPLVLCLFPGFFVVILGPAFLRIVATFGPIN